MTKPEQAQIREVILDSLRDEGALGTEAPADLAELRLVGQGALLKSVALVSMLVGVEQRLAEQFDLQVSLMDERAMSQRHSPFRNAQTLLDYIDALSRENRP